jgi:hypothetical protein
MLSHGSLHRAENEAEKRGDAFIIKPSERPVKWQ